jgi:hypothetical protein
MKHLYANKLGVSIEIKIFSNRVYLKMVALLKEAFKMALTKKGIHVEDKGEWMYFEIKDMKDEEQVAKELLKDFADGGFEITDA